MRIKAFVRKFYQRYLLDAMSAMALGLFASLIIGLILTQLSMIPALNFLASYGEIVSASSPVDVYKRQVQRFLKLVFRFVIVGVYAI